MMDKYLSQITIPPALLKLFNSKTNIEHVDDKHVECVQNDNGINSYKPLSDTLNALISNTQILFENDQSFNKIKELANKIENISDANQVLSEFSENICESAVNYTPEKLKQVFTLPHRIIEGFEFPAAYTKQCEQIQYQCRNIRNVSEYEQALQNTFSLIEKLYQDATIENKELERFLLNVGIQIGQIGDELHNFVAGQSSDIKIQNDINSKMNDAVCNLSENLLQADDLDVLKNTVKAQLNTLQNLVVEERQAVKKHEMSTSKNMNLLTNKVNELKRETHELKKEVKIEKENAQRDPLTGLFNREAYDNKVISLISEAENNNTVVSLLVWDIDHFKEFNDTYGHIVGDKVLKAVTKKLNNSLKESYFLARYGGEEFVMLLTGVSAEEALCYAENIRDEVSRITYLFKGRPLKVTISCGLSILQANDTPDKLFERADKSLYEAKMSGRNCVKYEETSLSA